MVPKHELFESIPLHDQGLNYGANVCELEDRVGERGWSLNWSTKLGLIEKNFFQIFYLHVRKHLNQIHVSLWFIAPP
jgi:hypothetical protein